jgi:hypothetical protein
MSWIEAYRHYQLPHYWTKWITAKKIRAQRAAKLSVNLPDGKFLLLGVLPA